MTCCAHRRSCGAAGQFVGIEVKGKAERGIPAARKPSAAILSAGALVVAEHARKRPTAESYPALQRVRVLEQGDAALSFYRVRLLGSSGVSL